MNFDSSKFCLGNLCQHGHDYQNTGQSLRYLKNQQSCVQCVKERAKRYRRNHLDREKERQRQYRLNNANKERERQKRYYQENTDKVKERKKRYYQENIDEIREYQKRYISKKFKSQLQAIHQAMSH
jgi:hypothetical protein